MLKIMVAILTVCVVIMGSVMLYGAWEKRNERIAQTYKEKSFDEITTKFKDDSFARDELRRRLSDKPKEIIIYKEFGELKAKVVPKKTRDQKLDDLHYRQSLETKEVTFGDGRKTKFYRNTPSDQERMKRDIQRQAAEQLRERIE
jgi:hypothetical protein